MNTKKIIFFVILIFLILMISGCVNEESSYEKEKRINNDYKNEHKPIKEMTNYIGTSGKISGEYLLVAGGVYGTIDTQHYMTLIYQVTIDGKTYHKSSTIPLENINFMTIGKNETSYLTIREYDGDWYTPENTSYFDTWKLEKINLYLPEGWQIIGVRGEIK